MHALSALDRMEETYGLLVAATLSDRPPDAQAILALRERFAIEFGSLLLALGDDLQARDRRDLYDELDDRLKTLRIRLMTYTMAWQPAEIEADQKAYRQAAQEIADLVRRFIRQTRAQLEPLRDNRPPTR